MTFLFNRSRHALTRHVSEVGTGAALPVTVIADTSTPVPGGKGSFDFMTYPQVSCGTVALQGAGKDQPANLYSSTGGKLILALPVGASIPSTGGKFTSFSRPVPAQQALLFAGAGLQGSSGVYVKSGEILKCIADTKTPVPSGVGDFGGFDFNSIDLDVGGAIAFVANDANGNLGVYASAFPTGEPRMVANSSTPIPDGSGTFNYYCSPSVSNHGIAFFASRSGSQASGVGLYLSRGGALEIVANTQTVVPNVGGTFSGFGSPALSGSAIAFHAIGTQGSQGIYLWRDDSLSVVADLTTPVPGGSGTFQIFFNDDPSIDEGGNVAFIAGYDNTQYGIFSLVDGRLKRIVTTEDTIGGQLVSYTGMSTNQLSKGVLTFYAVTTPGVFGNYTLPVA